MATNVAQLDQFDAEQRRAGRQLVAVDRATVRGHGETAQDARLLDLSIYGCRLASSGEHAAGDRLWLRLDGGWPIPATVVWFDGERLGCRFDHPIASNVMRDLTRALL